MANTLYRLTDRQKRQNLANLDRKTSDLAGFGNIQFPDAHLRFC